ncbi:MULTISPECIES: methylated-DNA--[protein]-cysteine S-methyltransferase [unclassified Helicobacter]|uniref:methylated-DNA--[protein]-cysteine S-methyltransferase n=1 Tax=unclassified Helicobacter TaxID=2593540 RepID=UPI000CF10595|nr:MULTISPECIES: methylated-DNA--[protein]-cysteine S-methyltransferase [unclassified Helicobacter]
MIYFDTCQTPIGDFDITILQDKIVSFLPSTPQSCEQRQTKLTQEVKKQVNAYFKGDLKEFILPLLIKGSDFKKKVLTQILQIEYGEQKSYKEIAREIANPLSYRAVGNACNQNDFCIIIPCHRVVSSHGIGGYALGLDKKIFLLKLEGSLK